MPTSWKLLPSNVFLLVSKGNIVNRQELLNDSTNKQILNEVIKQQLTGFVIEYNTEVSGQRAPGEGWPGQPCTRGDLSSLSFQNKDLIYELHILNHMLLFVSKSSRAFGLIMQHYKLASKEFQNKVCGRRRPFRGAPGWDSKTCAICPPCGLQSKQEGFACTLVC